MRFGKKAATYDPRDLHFAHYNLTPAMAAPVPPRPLQFGHEDMLPPKGWGMLGNDQVGDCVFAGAGHETMLWREEAGSSVTFTDANAIGDYSAVTGYVPGEPKTDQGTDVRTALKYRRNVGIVDANGIRHKIGAYLSLEPGNLDHVREALFLFGAVGIGFQFPASAMAQFNAGRSGSVVAHTSNQGGHYVPLVAQRANIVCVTWGQVQQMTAGFYAKYCDEAWAILSTEMLVAGKTLEGFDLAQLQADLKAL